MSSDLASVEKPDGDAPDTDNQETEVWCGRCDGQGSGPYTPHGLKSHTGQVHGDVDPIILLKDACCRGKTGEIPYHKFDSGRAEHCQDCGRILGPVERNREGNNHV